jgi:hypothetical protein
MAPPPSPPQATHYGRHIHPLLTVWFGIFAGGILGAVVGALGSGITGAITIVMLTLENPMNIVMHTVYMGLVGSVTSSFGGALVGIALGFRVSSDRDAAVTVIGSILGAIVGLVIGCAGGYFSADQAGATAFPLIVIGGVIGTLCGIIGGAGLGMMINSRYQ